MSADEHYLDVPEIEAAMVAAMQEVGVHPAIIYATQQTGRMVTEMNQHLLSDEDLREWDEAIARWERLNGPM